MKTTIAYGLQYENETLEQAADHYVRGPSQSHTTKKDALRFIKTLKNGGSIGKKVKVRIFKIIVESEK